ncbi:MAG: hypothetical protein KAW89_10105 [Armatimonadetes bacterium]|nr:hypothetical protein [Armatimonadota bacterium]
MQTTVSETDWSAAKRARVAVARRQRRVIFNTDSEEMTHKGANTVEGFLAPRLRPLVGTHVGTISYAVTDGDAPTYASKVQPVFGEAHGNPTPPHPDFYEHYVANLNALIQAGHCPLRIVTEFAHDNSMEAFASVRMNDVHDSFIPGWQTTWKKQHPELLVDTQGMLPSMQLYTTAQDFTHEQVRQRKLEIIQEICQRYDVDGFELDYIRHPVMFSRVMRGEPATQQEVEIMTTLMRRIRQLTDEAAARRARPVLLSARVPDSFELAMNIGLDLKTWLEQDLVDILIAGGGYAPFTLPVTQFTQMAHQYEVPVYPCINLSAALNVSDGAYLECVRALAANWYQAGADGIYLWNLGTPFIAPFLAKSGEDVITTRQRFYACLDEVGEAETLVGKDKLFCVDASVNANYTFVSSQPPLPLTLRKGVVQRIPLVVGDDVEAASNNSLLGQLKLMLKLKGPVEQEALLLRLNGDTLSDGEFLTLDAQDQESQINYPISAPPLTAGQNFIEVSLASVPTSPVELNSIRLNVEYESDA